MFENFLHTANYLAIGVAALVYFILGAIWYTPALFGKTWMAEIGKSKDQLMGGPKIIYLLTFCWIALSCLATAFMVWLTGTHEIIGAVKVGGGIGVCYILSSNSINSMFAQRSFKLVLIDGGYHVTGIVIAAIILGYWH